MAHVDQAKELKRSMAAAPTRDDTLFQITRVYRALIGGKGACSIWLVDPDADKVTLAACDGYDYSLEEIEQSAGERPHYLLKPRRRARRGRVGMTASILLENRSVHAETGEEMARHPAHLGKYESALWKDPGRTQSFYGTPLWGKGGVPIGLIKVEHPDARFFTDEKQAQLELVAAVASAVVDRDALVEAARQVFWKAAGGATFEETLRNLVRECRDTLSASACSIFLPDWRADGRLALAADNGHDNYLVGEYGEDYTYEPGEAATGTVFKSGQAVRANSPDEVKRAPGHEGREGKLWYREWRDKRECQSFYVVPIKNLSKECVGVLRAEDKIGRDGGREGNHFTAWDAELLDHIAFQLGIFLERQAAELQARFGAVGGLRESVGRTLLSVVKGLSSQGGGGDDND